MLHAHTLQRFGDQLIAGAVEGGEDDREIVGHLFDALGIIDLSHDVGEELLVGLITDQGDHAVPDGLVVVSQMNGVENVQLVHFGGNGAGMVGRQLCAVLPIDLIAVVLLGVVGGGDIDAGNGMILPYGKTQLGSGAQGVKKPHLDAVSGHDAGGLPGKLLRVVAAVEAHHDAAVHSLLPLGLDDLGKGLSGVTDDVDIHPVQADGHSAAQTGGTELQRAEEPALDLFGIICDGSKLSAGDASHF